MTYKFQAFCSAALQENTENCENQPIQRFGKAEDTLILTKTIAWSVQIVVEIRLPNMHIIGLIEQKNVTYLHISWVIYEITSN